MAKTNAKPIDRRRDKTTRLAGGYGPYVAKQDAEAILRRAVLANLLWEDLAYTSGDDASKSIRNLIPQVPPAVVAEIAAEARLSQKLRHVPLFIAREMARIDTHKGFVGDLLPRIIMRADELTEFLAIYWKDDAKQPLSSQVKKGLAKAACKFDAYQLSKYNRDEAIRLRDVIFLTHPAAKDNTELGSNFAKLVNRTFFPDKTKFAGFDVKSAYGLQGFDKLAPADTWEVAHSQGKDKKETWIRLIEDRKLGALAFVRNLRAMEQLGVPRDTILQGFKAINPRWLLPLNYLAAANEAPRWERELEELMLRGLATAPKLPGHSVFVVDVSGSMGAPLSSKSKFNRMEAASAMAMLAAEMCERISVYATAGNDHTRVHATALVKPRRGFALTEEILSTKSRLGGGGIFTRQCLEYIKASERSVPDRILIFSDSQDCDHPHSRTPNPFGKRNYIIDVSSERHGINYDGLWTAEVSGWSEHFLKFIAALEGIEVTGEESDQQQNVA